MENRNFTRAKWFVMGILVTLMLSGTALLASPAMREVIFGVRVAINGDVIQFEEDMQPFIMEGRTFLPVRAIADIAGFGVDFDGDTNTVHLRSAGQVPGGGGGAQDEAGQLLVGSWTLLDLYITFNADGTGSRQYPDIPHETFLWRAEGDHLMIDLLTGITLQDPHYYIIYESWTYNVNANLGVLTMTSRQIDGMEVVYLADVDIAALEEGQRGAQDAAARQLVGIWFWDGGTDYTYTFNSDGTGIRGFDWAEMHTFYWSAEGDHIMMDFSHHPNWDYITVESWTFGITNNVLTITSRQIPGMEFSYIRSN